MKPYFFTVLVAGMSLNISMAAELPRSTPEAQGVSSSAILNFVQAADKITNALHSFMLLRHGQIVAEGWWSPYEAQAPHVLFSLSKSFTSTAVGLAIAEGKFSLDDEVLKFFPEDAPPEPSKNLKAMRVRDLLRMNTGHETEPPRPKDKSWRKAFLEHPVRYKPSTHFLYNTSATYMLAAIVEKTTGMALMDFLRPRLFAPIGIENPTWDKSPEGVTLGGYGLSIRTEDIARFGQLYLQKGKWQGKQLVPEAWVEAATSFQTANGSNPKSDWDQGYGYQFWRCRNGCYRGDGAFGQYCVVMPQQDAVIAITGGLGDMQEIMDLIWDKLLPGMSASTLPADEANRRKLVEMLNSLSLRPQPGSAGAPNVFGKKFVFPANDKKLESITLERSPQNVTTIIGQFNGATERVDCGHNSWKNGQAAWGSEKVQPVAASGAWTADDTFTARICFSTTPFIQKVTLKFSGDGLRYNSEANVAFGPTKEPELIGNSK